MRPGGRAMPAAIDKKRFGPWTALQPKTQSGPQPTHPAKPRLFRCAERSQALNHLCLRLSTAMKCPTEGRAPPNSVRDIQPRAALDQEPRHRLVTTQDGLMQGRRVRMVAFRIVAVGILAGIKQQTDNLRMSLLRGQRERAMARYIVGGREQTDGIVHPAQPGSAGQVDARPALSQGLGSVDHPEGQGGKQRPSPFPCAAPFDGGAEIQQQLNERHLESYL